MLSRIRQGISEMENFDYDRSGFAVRNDLKEAYREFWATLAQPGTWWDGSERVAIASACGGRRAQQRQGAGQE